MISSLIHQCAHSEYLAESYSVFFISERGIDANPEKVGTILRMKRPVRVHDVQKLTGCFAALSRFISRLGEKALPLYRLMKKENKFEWTPKADAAFAELETLLSTQPVLAAPISKEPLLIYIAATGQVVSTVLTVEREEEGKTFKVQRPVYYLSDKLCCKESSHLLANGFFLLNGGPSKMFFNRFRI